jgi:hypothetical protein
MPVRVTLERDGDRRIVVWRIASANELGHDRRSDRAANQLLAHDDFSAIPDHIRALAVGVMHRDGSVVSIGEGEVFLVTTYAPDRAPSLPDIGAPYEEPVHAEVVTTTSTRSSGRAFLVERVVECGAVVGSRRSEGDPVVVDQPLRDIPARDDAYEVARLRNDENVV